MNAGLVRDITFKIFLSRGDHVRSNLIVTFGAIGCLLVMLLPGTVRATHQCTGNQRPFHRTDVAEGIRYGRCCDSSGQCTRWTPLTDEPAVRRDQDNARRPTGPARGPTQTTASQFAGIGCAGPDCKDTDRAKTVQKVVLQPTELSLPEETSKFYARLVVRGQMALSDPHECVSRGLASAIRRLFFKSAGGAELLVTPYHVNKDEKLYQKPLPVLLVKLNEGNEGTIDKENCFTKVLGQKTTIAITPYFRVDSNSRFKVDFQIGYWKDNDFVFSKQITDEIVKAHEAVPGFGWVAAKLTEKKLTDVLRKIESQLNTNWQNASKDLRTEAIPASSQEAILFSLKKFNLKKFTGVRIDKEVGAVALFSIERRDSLFKEGGRYFSDSRTILDSELVDGKSFRDLLKQNELDGIDDAQFEAVNAESDSVKKKSRFAKLCISLADAISNQMKLTLNDRRLLTYAALREYSPYNDDISIRSDKCLNEKDLDFLASIGFKLKYIRKNWSNRPLTGRLSKLLAVLSGSKNLSDITDEKDKGDWYVRKHALVVLHKRANGDDWPAEIKGGEAPKAVKELSGMQLTCYAVLPKVSQQLLFALALPKGATRHVAAKIEFTSAKPDSPILGIEFLPVERVKWLFETAGSKWPRGQDSDSPCLLLS